MTAHIITPPNNLNMMWLIPQYVIITAGEVMFSVTGLEFSFTQAPASMKSVLQACWLLTVAVGNILVVVIAELQVFERQSYEFFLFAILMIIDMIVFMFLALRYKYINTAAVHDEQPNITLETAKEPQKRIEGFANAGYTEDF